MNNQTINGQFYSPEGSLDKSRSPPIHNACRTLYALTDSGDLYGSVSAEREAMDSAVAIVLKVKKIKKDLHKQ